MPTPRLRKYLKNRKNNPMSKEEVATSPDAKIDQDFSGLPLGNTSEGIINPKTKNEKKTADVNKKDGEKKLTGKTKE